MASEVILAKFQTRFDELNAKLQADRTEALTHQKKLQGIFSRMLRPLRDMEKAFREKPPGLALKNGKAEYQNFDEWLADYVEPLTGFKKRQAYYALHIAKNLVDKVTDEELEQVGIEKAKELSKYAESKGTPPAELMEKAKTSTVTELHAEVKSLVFKGNPDHEDRSGWDTIEIEGPRSHTTQIRNFLQLIRRQEGHKPSDAELLALAVEVQYRELQEAEAKRREEVSGIPAPTLGR